LHTIACSCLFVSVGYEQFLNLSVKILEGSLVESETDALAGEIGIDSAVCWALCQAAGSLLWEFVKGAPADAGAVSTSLKQMGISESLAEEFAKCYQVHKRGLSAVKGSLSISSMRYKDLTWRLDVELARRTVAVMQEPKFQLRLDLAGGGGAGQSEGGTHSLHIQADYANMKKLQQELQNALDEQSNTHCQRLARYIT
jgi:hypothetical protein